MVHRFGTTFLTTTRFHVWRAPPDRRAQHPLVVYLWSLISANFRPLYPFALVDSSDGRNCAPGQSCSSCRASHDVQTRSPLHRPAYPARSAHIRLLAGRSESSAKKRIPPSRLTTSITLHFPSAACAFLTASASKLHDKGQYDVSTQRRVNQLYATSSAVRSQSRPLLFGGREQDRCNSVFTPAVLSSKSNYSLYPPASPPTNTSSSLRH